MSSACIRIKIAPRGKLPDVREYGILVQATLLLGTIKIEGGR
jgi:hypothetical protein